MTFFSLAYYSESTENESRAEHVVLSNDVKIGWLKLKILQLFTENIKYAGTRLFERGRLTWRS